jgi:hypothetical protein
LESSFSGARASSPSAIGFFVIFKLISTRFGLGFALGRRGGSGFGFGFGFARGFLSGYLFLRSFSPRFSAAGPPLHIAFVSLVFLFEVSWQF